MTHTCGLQWDQRTSVSWSSATNNKTFARSSTRNNRTSARSFARNKKTSTRGSVSCLKTSARNTSARSFAKNNVIFARGTLDALGPTQGVNIDYSPSLEILTYSPGNDPKVSSPSTGALGSNILDIFHGYTLPSATRQATRPIFSWYSQSKLKLPNC